MNDRVPDLAGAHVPDRDHRAGRTVVSAKSSVSFRVRAAAAKRPTFEPSRFDPWLRLTIISIPRRASMPHRMTNSERQCPRP